MRAKRSRLIPLRWLGALLVAVAVTAESAALAQPPQRRRLDPATIRAMMEARAKRMREAKAKKKDDEKKQPGPVLAIQGADIVTVTREVIRDGVLLVQDGKILDVGQGLEIPKGAKVIDATGKVVTPGFIALSVARLGVGSPSRSTDKFGDYLDPFDRNLKFALGVGITTGVATVNSRRGFRGRAPDEFFPGLELPPEDLETLLEGWNPDFGDPDTAVCQCCGLPILPTEPITRPRPSQLQPQRHAVIKCSFGSLDGMLVRESAFFHAPSNALDGALNKDALRRMVAQARDYLKKVEEHEKETKDGKKSRPPRKPVSDEVIAMAKGEIRLRTDANTQDQIRDMIALAKELGVKLLLDGATEAWTVPDLLSESETPVVITPRRRRRPRFAQEDSTGSNIESSRILESAGVPFSVAALSTSISLNGIAGRDLTSLPLEAAFAVRGGCSEKAALEALTIVPARILGLDERLGSIEKGKDADLLILDGPPLDYRTYVQTALVNGRVVYDKQKDRVFPN